MRTDISWLRRPTAPGEAAAMTDADRGYAFPHAAADESRRLQLLEERLDPATIRRIERLQLVPGPPLVEPYVSVRPMHIRAGAEHVAIELEPPVEGGLHAELLKPTPDVNSVQRGDGRYALFCLDETGRTLYRFLFGQLAVDRWAAGEPPPPWAVEVLRRVPALKPEGADLNALLNP